MKVVSSKYLLLNLALFLVCFEGQCSLHTSHSRRAEILDDDASTVDLCKVLLRADHSNDHLCDRVLPRGGAKPKCCGVVMPCMNYCIYPRCEQLRNASAGGFPDRRKTATHCCSHGCSLGQLVKMVC